VLSSSPRTARCTKTTKASSKNIAAKSHGNGRPLQGSPNVLGLLNVQPSAKSAFGRKQTLAPEERCCRN
jgi:hypothetical protein